MANQQTKCRGILLLSSGSKVAIAKIAKRSALSRGLSLHASDCIPNVPTRHIADKFAVFDDQDRSQWIGEILAYCETHSIGLLIPTRHTDLPYLARASKRFAAINTTLSLSGEETINLCTQKLDTANFLARIQAPAPKTTTKENLSACDLVDLFPLFAKPATGASAIGATPIHGADQLETIPNDWILQTLATGQEYTVNIYIDRNGEPLCAIPHARLAVEAGEVVQARTERIPKLIEECMSIAKSLPNAQGIINIQAFYDHTEDTFQIIEINPRIGGGFPLAHQAKGTYIEWLCKEYLDHKAPEPFNGWTEDLLMQRYREAIFTL